MFFNISVICRNVPNISSFPATLEISTKWMDSCYFVCLLPFCQMVATVFKLGEICKFYWRPELYERDKRSRWTQLNVIKTHLWAILPDFHRQLWLFHGEDFNSHDPTLALILIEITSAEMTCVWKVLCQADVTSSCTVIAGRPWAVSALTSDSSYVLNGDCRRLRSNKWFWVLPF